MIVPGWHHFTVEMTLHAQGSSDITRGTRDEDSEQQAIAIAITIALTTTLVTVNRFVNGITTASSIDAPLPLPAFDTRRYSATCTYAGLQNPSRIAIDMDSVFVSS